MLFFPVFNKYVEKITKKQPGFFNWLDAGVSDQYVNLVKKRRYPVLYTV